MMDTNTLNAIRIRCMICFGIALIIFAMGAVWLLKDYNGNRNTNTSDKRLESASGTSTELADEMIFYPDNIQLNQKLQDLYFYKANSDVVKLSDFYGKNVIIMFWASWCEYCRDEFDYIKDYADLIKKHDDVEFILLNKLDGIKETREQAMAYLKENNIPFTAYFDEKLKIYNNLGIKIVPTFLGINRQGVLKICKPGNIGGSDGLSAFVDYVKYGGMYGTEQFITNQLTNDNGGVHTNYLESNNSSPSGYDVLSESQGIMMEYGVLKKDKALFERYLSYVTEKMLGSNSLASWIVTEEGKSNINSLVDDFRIYKALYQANKLWGGYDRLVKQWEKGILKYNTKRNNIVDSYDFKYKKKAQRLTLCFADFEALQLLQQSDKRYEGIYENALQLVKAGYISNEFPLYYSWYDYEKKQYVPDNLNTAEAMYTLLNLAKAGELKKETIDWIKTTMNNGGIKARYTVEGKVVDGYNYESAAVYAIISMIAGQIHDDRLMSDALVRMERLRVNNKASLLNGSFSGNDEENIYSFDQCMPLLAYAYIEYQ